MRKFIRLIRAAPVCALAIACGPAVGDEVMTMSPMADAIVQNTPGHSEGYAAGVPPDFAWCRGSYKVPGHSMPPPGFTAVTGWGQVYPKAGTTAPYNPNARIIVANFQTFLRLSATGGWIVVQDQSAGKIAGGHFVADFAGNEAVEMDMKVLPDRSAALGAPPPGYNTHFWINERGSYPPGSVDGVYVQMDVRVTDADVELVANIGADWWRDSTSGFVPGFANNPGAGMSNWVELSPQWSSLRFYSGLTPELLIAPPPPLIELISGAKPIIVRRTAGTPAPCLPVAAEQTPQ